MCSISTSVVTDKTGAIACAAPSPSRAPTTPSVLLIPGASRLFSVAVWIAFQTACATFQVVVLHCFCAGTVLGVTPVLLIRALQSHLSLGRSRFPLPFGTGSLPTREHVARSRPFLSLAWQAHVWSTPCRRFSISATDLIIVLAFSLPSADNEGFTNTK
jgi:hypothetical protein